METQARTLTTNPSKIKTQTLKQMANHVYPSKKTVVRTKESILTTVRRGGVKTALRIT